MNLSFRYIERVKQSVTPLIKELSKKGFVNEKYACREIQVPSMFSFQKNFDESIMFFKRLLSSFIYKRGHLRIDFSNCVETSNANYVVFDLFVRDLKITQERYNTNIFKKNYKQIVVSPSEKDDKTNKYLIAGRYVSLDEVDNVNKNDSFLPLNLIRGKNKNYKEGLKGRVAKNISSFVQKAMLKAEYSIFAKDNNALEGYITEILANAEDHSISNSEWYISGISFHEDQHDTNVVELNLTILDVGKTMYEGFEETRDQNHETYSKLEYLYQRHVALFQRPSQFEKESLFMLYMLNNGISRLKYKEESRGNGTMHFIYAFMYLGRYGIEHTEFNPVLNIISGHTVLTCDGKHKHPGENSSEMILSLNEQQSLDFLPEEELLRAYVEYFPGTIIECKIYLNKEYFQAISKAA